MSGIAEAERTLIDWDQDERFPYYTRGNAGEVLPDPVSPLGWTLVWEGALLPGWWDGFVDIGVMRPDEGTPERPPLFGMFGGRLYLNLSGTRMIGARMPGSSVEVFDAAFVQSGVELPPYEADPRDECPECTARLAETVGWIMGAADYPELDEERAQAEAARAGRPTLEALSDADLIARARSFAPFLRRGAALHAIASIASSVGPAALTAILGGLGRDGDMMRLICGLGDVDSAAPSFALWELSREVCASPELTSLFDGGVSGLRERLATVGEGRAFLERFDGFVSTHGARGPNEWDIRADTWETRPELALALIDRMRKTPADKAPAARAAGMREDRERLSAELGEMLAANSEVHGAFQAALRSAAVFMAARERAKTNLVRVINEVRLAVRELGRRGAATGVLGDAGDIAMLLAHELDDYIADPAAFTTVLAERRARHLALDEIEPPLVLVDVPPLSSWPRRSAAAAIAPVQPGETIVGAAGCPGRHVGRACVITDPSDVDALEPGDVLIAPFTDPAWTPLFVTAGAVVVDIGATNSHAVIVSRELGIPCVVSVPQASRRITSGTTVEVDGSAGTITVLEVG